jgi:hypothetical protein
MVGWSLAGLVRGMQQVRKIHVGMVLGLSTSGIHVSMGQFLATGVAPVRLWPLVTVSNLGALSCLVAV